MSSQAPTSTQPSERSSSVPFSPSDISSLSFSSYRDLTGEKISQDVRQLQQQGIYYAGEKINTSHYDFVYSKALRGDILIPKDPNSDLSEFVLAGIFEIDGRNFFMTSDGKWNSSNPIGTEFFQVKPSCLLLPVQRDPDFIFSSNDFSSIIANIRAIETLANPRKSHDITSIIVTDSTPSSAIKLSHQLFIVNNLTPSFSRISF